MLYLQASLEVHAPPPCGLDLPPGRLLLSSRAGAASLRPPLPRRRGAGRGRRLQRGGLRRPGGQRRPAGLPRGRQHPPPRQRLPRRAGRSSSTAASTASEERASSSGRASSGCGLRRATRATRPGGPGPSRPGAWSPRAPTGCFASRRTGPTTSDVFRAGNVRAVVHLGVMHDPRASANDHHSWNVVGFGKMLESMAQFGVKKLVVLSSASVYGPRPDNPQFLAEESPLLGSQDFSEIRDLIEVDMLAQSFFWRHPSCETVILRPTHILGAVKNAPSNYLRLPVAPTLMGFDPMIQVIHFDDVARAVVMALRPGARGIFNLAGPEPVPLSRILKMLGRPRLPIPHGAARSMLSELFRYRLSSFPAPELDHIRYVCMVDDRRARDALGYAPRHGLRDTVFSVEES
nr:NAD-dependent epimerase/dehydratase family protein [Deltaproteobacteria bacterium]